MKNNEHPTPPKSNAMKNNEHPTPHKSNAMKKINTQRRTTETDINIRFGLGYAQERISSGIPFFDHLLHAFSLHGNLYLAVEAKGDLAIDFHHTVEDIGLVLGEAMATLYQSLPTMTRFGHAIIPMDDALAEVTLDLCNRPYCVYSPILPQTHILNFDTALINEFFCAVSTRAKMTVHLTIHHARNSHHALEALFKAFGIAYWRACQKPPAVVAHISTKGTL